MTNCVLCGMRGFYILGGMTLCKHHGDDHKRRQQKVEVKNNIRMVWTYWDGRKRCFHYTLEEVPTPWRDEAIKMRVRVHIEHEDRILKAEMMS